MGLRRLKDKYGYEMFKGRYYIGRQSTLRRHRSYVAIAPDVKALLRAWADTEGLYIEEAATVTIVEGLAAVNGWEVCRPWLPIGTADGRDCFPRERGLG